MRERFSQERGKLKKGNGVSERGAAARGYKAKMSPAGNAQGQPKQTSFKGMWQVSKANDRYADISHSRKQIVQRCASMSDAIKASATKMFTLQKLVHSGSPNSVSSEILQEHFMQEGEQSSESEEMAFQAGKPEPLAWTWRSRTCSDLAQSESGLLAKTESETD